MFGFGHIFRKPRQFDYRPRYYDPEKEVRDQRRRELFGDRAVPPEPGKEYRPGSYIRDNMMARRGIAQAKSREKREKIIRRGVIFLVLMIGMALYLIYG